MIGRPTIAALCALLLASAGMNAFLLLREGRSAGNGRIDELGGDAGQPLARRVEPGRDTFRQESKVTTVRRERSTSHGELEPISCERQLTAAHSELEMVRAQF